MQYSLGIDYGTNSVRAVIVRCQDGKEIASSTYDYPSGRQGVLLDPKDHHVARQHPADYLVGLEKTVRGAIKSAARTKGFHPHRIVGIGVDATGSSPLPVDQENRALACLPKWKKTSMLNAGSGKIIPAIVRLQPSPL